ncbi:MAG: NAD(P)H-hydrate dehydratase [Candidatus Velthaea sp.]
MLRVRRKLLRAWPLPAPSHADKDGRGRVLVVGGAPEMPGAAILAATAALRAGAGKLQIATCASIAPHVAVAMPEALVAGYPQTASGAISASCAQALSDRANRCDALVFGPGMVDEAACGELFAALVDRLHVPALLDATVLACIGERADLLRGLDGRAVVTPHAGEMARMLSVSREKVEGDPARHARDAARRFGATVALKGAETYIATPEGEMYRNDAGHLGLATSGSGDTLAGIIGGLLARGASPPQAAVWGVFLHARAGERLARSLGVGFLARELLVEIPRVMRRVQ